MGVIEQRLQSLGLALPEAKVPVANYLGTKRCGNLLFVSGRVSQLCGEVGTEVLVAEAKAAAQATVLDLLAIIKHDIGDLDHVIAVDQIRGFVRSAPTCTAQPEIIDGASDLLIQLWSDAGRHARTATGVVQLPFGATVQLDMMLRLSDQPGEHAGQTIA